MSSNPLHLRTLFHLLPLSLEFVEGIDSDSIFELTLANTTEQPL